MNETSIPILTADERLREDARRLVHPEPHDPLFERASRRGCEWRSCNVAGRATKRREHEYVSTSIHGPMKIDWLLCRELTTREPEAIPAMGPLTGSVLSDHDAIAVGIELP